ncbi:GrpE protein-like protein, mitochondrial [Aphelenchoides bicaudatus]|nr:GrpE protein-like protein, mitochondrial [Aphelenchoides bicaudatus]
MLRTLLASRPAMSRLIGRNSRFMCTDTKQESQKSEPQNPEPQKQEEAAPVDEYKEKYFRAIAETENVRRRGQKQVEDAKVFAIQKFCKDLLEVADILDLAVESVDKSVVVRDPQLKSVYDGIVMTKEILQKAFERNGLEVISPEGQRFDPNMHDAVFQIPKGQAKHEPGNVEKVLKIGYSLHGRPVRAAQVGVVQM